MEIDESIVYIDAPTFTHSSNGIRCIYSLAESLARIGVNIEFLPRNIRGFNKMMPKELRKIKACPLWNIQARAALICTESVPAKTILMARKKGLRILWWYLAPHGLLEKPAARPRPGEKIVTFSPLVYPDKEFCYFQPPLDTPWARALETFRPKSDHKTIEIGLYCGKGRLKSIPEKLRAFLFNSNIRIITRTSPATREELFSLLITIDGLITFDELSQLSLEAGTLGVPVFSANPLFTRNCLNMFPVDITSLVTHDAWEFMQRLTNRREGRLKSISKSSLFASNNDAISCLAHAVATDSWEWVATDKARYYDIIKYGRHLREKRVLYPHYSGQSAGTYFLGLYVASLNQNLPLHNLVCGLISLADELGRLMLWLGCGKIFKFCAGKINDSKSLKMGLRHINKLAA
jgi:hypothetical protein